MDSHSSSEVFPGFSKTFRLGESGASRAFRVEIAVAAKDAFPITRGEIQPAQPVIAKWCMGARVPSDFIWATLVGLVLISDRVANVLREQGARGWSTYEVAVLGKGGETIPGYQGLVVHGRCGPIDNSRSVEVMKECPGGVFPTWQGVYFDSASWDGSGIFMADGRTAWIFVVESLRRAFERAHLKNVAFKALADIERSQVEMNVPMK